MENFKQDDCFHKTLTIILSSIGLNVLEKNWHWNLRIRSVIFSVLTAVGLYVINLYKYRDDFDYICYSTVINAPIFGGLHRLCNWSVNSEIAYNLYEGYINLKQKFGEDLGERRILEKYIIFMNFLVAMIVLFLILIGSFMLLTPFLLYFLVNNSQLVLPIPIYLVYIDMHTRNGYILNYIYQIVLVYIGVALFMTIQSLNVFYVGTTAFLIEILRYRVRKFENIVLMSTVTSGLGDVIKVNIEIKREFKKLIQFHNELNDYSRNVEKILSFQWFLDVTLFSVSVCVAIFYARIANWIPGYILGSAIVVVGFFNHGLGELVTIQMEKLYSEIYSVSWYRLDLKTQKLFILLLLKVQNCHLLSCGGFRPIGLELFGSFVHSVYSYNILLNDLLQKYDYQ